MILHGHVPNTGIIKTLAHFFGADTGTVQGVAGIVQLADVPDELLAKIKSMVRRLYRFPERERSLIVQHVAQLCDLLEDRPGHPSVPPPTAPNPS